MRLALVSLLLGAAPLAAQRAPESAPITGVGYELTFTAATAARRSVHVRMAFDVRGTDPVLLSLPAWTPGSYDLGFFARKVSGFTPAMAGGPLRWDLADFDTWRVRPTGAGRVTVEFDVRADTLDNGMAWSQSDFLMVNGTSVFPYAEGRSLAFPATVTVHTDPGWLVATGTHAAGAPATWREGNYHDLVDMPWFIGRFDLDSALVAGKWTRLASYPAGRLAGTAREHFWRDLRGIIPAESAVFGETPWDDYTTMVIFEDSFGGGSALEHQSSHVGIYTPGLIDNPILTNVTAHEIFHAWNVKRLRPADMVPYRYDVAQPTTLLWVSEGFTSYYADVAMLRGGLWDSTAFVNAMLGHAQNVANTPPVAPEDASLQSWIRPTDGTAYSYYESGAAIGFLLDIRIRAASDNRRGLDDVMRGLYDRTYRRGRGFTTAEFWSAVQSAAGRSFADFADRYVDGREPLPWQEVLPLAGLRWESRLDSVPRIGIGSGGPDSAGVVVTAVTPGGAFAAAGGQVGDLMLSVAGIPLQHNPAAFATFRERFAGRSGVTYPIVVRRGDTELTLTARLVLAAVTNRSIAFDPAASASAVRVRRGLFDGRTGP